MSMPTLTPEQRSAALAKGVEARQARAAAKAELRAGTLTLAAALDDEGSPLQRARVREVLLALPGVGQVTADQILADVRIDPARRVGGLGPRQRQVLTERLA
jgi:transposase